MEGNNVIDQNAQQGQQVNQNNNNKPEVTQTQTQNNGITQEQLTQAINAAVENAQKGFLSSLGFSDADTAKSVFGIFSQLANTGQQQNNQNQNIQQSQENEKTIKLEAQVEAMKLGAKPDKVDNVVILAMAKNKSNVAEAIKDLKKEQPEWFADTQQGNSSGTGSNSGNENNNAGQGNKGTGSAPSGSSRSGANTDGIGKRLAESKKKATPKVKYF